MSAQQETELALCVQRMVQEYLDHLAGERCQGVYDMVLSSVEKPLLELILRHNGGNLTHAATMLGLHRTTLRKKLNQYNLI